MPICGPERHKDCKQGVDHDTTNDSNTRPRSESGVIPLISNIDKPAIKDVLGGKKSLLFDRLDYTIGLESNLQGSVIPLERKIENVHAGNRGAAPQDRAPQTEKMLSRKRFGRQKVLRRGDGDTVDLLRNLDSRDV